MAFGDPLQLLVIGVIVVVIFLWGPQKIPQLARAIGRAKGEFDNASKEFTNTALLSGSATSSGQPPAHETGDQILLETARKLGISTEGKTKEQISQEIISRSRTQT